jgi:alkylation response protein AidB-like acyl-CoA dehydrogenase
MHELILTDEQSSLSSIVGDLLAAHSAEARVRVVMESSQGVDDALWTRMSEELGICGLAVPEEYGGAGAGFTEVAVVLEELGKSLACVPYLSSVVLSQTLLSSIDDEDARRRWLPGLCSGRLRATVAFAEPSQPWTADGIYLPATKSGGGWTVSGVKTAVIDGAAADVIFVAARTGDGLSVFEVDGNAPGLVRTPLPTMDLTRRQARLEFDSTLVTPVGPVGQAASAVTRMLAFGAAALSIEAIGGAQRVLDMAVDYAQTRVQFGRAIGTFQAIKHKCANMLMQLESARSAAYHMRGVAAGAASSGSRAPGLDTDFQLAVSLAKSVCTDAYTHCAAENIQIHGGVGFTWEHPAHLYFKRAKANELMFGDPIFHRMALADLLGI